MIQKNQLMILAKKSSKISLYFRGGDDFACTHCMVSISITFHWETSLGISAVFPKAKDE